MLSSESDRAPILYGIIIVLFTQIRYTTLIPDDLINQQKNSENCLKKRIQFGLFFLKKRIQFHFLSMSVMDSMNSAETQW